MQSVPVRAGWQVPQPGRSWRVLAAKAALRVQVSLPEVPRTQASPGVQADSKRAWARVMREPVLPESGLVFEQVQVRAS